MKTLRKFNSFRSLLISIVHSHSFLARPDRHVKNLVGINIMEAKPTLSREETRRVIPLKEMFEAHCHLDPISDAMGVNHLPFSQLSMWLESATIIDMNRVTKTDAYLCFFKFEKRAINYGQFLTYLEDLADEKDLDLKEMKQKLKTCGKPDVKTHLPKREK